MPVCLSGKDSYLDLRGGNPKLPVCPACGIILDPYGHGFPGKAKPKYDLSSTTEDMDLVSPRLKALLEQQCTSPLEFFETGGGYFVLRPGRSVVLDLTELNPDHAALCKTCGKLMGLYALVIEPKVLPGQTPIGPLDLVRSQQEFGTLRQRNSVLIAGDQLAVALKAERMKGVMYPT